MYAGSPACAAGDTFVASNVQELVRLRLHVRQPRVEALERLRRVAHSAVGACLNKSDTRVSLLLRRRRGQPPPLANCRIPTIDRLFPVPPASPARAKGRVFFTAGRDLDRYVVWDYVQRRRAIVS